MKHISTPSGQSLARVLGIAALLMAGAALPACDNEPHDVREATEDAVDEVDDGLDEAGDAIEDTADDIDDEIGG